jgi:hypothetical protein
MQIFRQQILILRPRKLIIRHQNHENAGKKRKFQGDPDFRVARPWGTRQHTEKVSKLHVYKNNLDKTDNGIKLNEPDFENY